MHTIKSLITALAFICGAATAAHAQQPVGNWDFTSRAEAIRDKSGHVTCERRAVSG